MEADSKKLWEAYRDSELARLTPILTKEGITLENEQPHISGERYLMSGKKLVLIGHENGERVVIKVSSDEKGAGEIAHEHKVKETLQNLKFAYYILFSPKELLYTKIKGFTILVSEYIAQEKNFLARPLEEQFFLTLRALKSQEGVHATTRSHSRAVAGALGTWNADAYISSFVQLREAAVAHAQSDAQLAEALSSAERLLRENQETIQQYCAFLTHTDFLPHNLRIKDDTIYLLDHTSLRFGNKYESWARFLNFMLLYNRPLHDYLLQYVRDNRSPEEYLSLRLMRIYKLTYLLAFYAESLEKTSGDLHTLSLARITFWTSVLNSLIQDTSIPQEIIEAYQHSRDALRSAEEKQRQKELH